MSHVVKSIEFSGKTLSLETGRMAKQADGSVFIKYGDSAVLCTVCCTGEPKPHSSFFPLSCDYQEKFYAAGSIPGSYFRREGRPSEKDVLVSRMIDRPARPLFPDGFMCETQIIATVVSFDRENDTDVIAMLGSFAAVSISNVPWDGPVAALRVGRVDGEFIANPTFAQRAVSDLDLVVAVGPKGLVMVEGEANFIPEAVMVDAMLFAEKTAQDLLALVREFVAVAGKPKFEWEAPKVDQELADACREVAWEAMSKAATIPTKMERYAAISKVKADAVAALAGRFEGRESDIKAMTGSLKSAFCRDQIIKTKTRLDGRKLDEVRKITIELGVLDRAHGSALFTRGETQGLIAVTLGTSSDDQRVELLSGMTSRRFMLHYNFPPFCVGEVKFLRGPGRREIGHGNLAHRGVTPVLPGEDMFPYVLRSVSEVLESNGSSSMATVCGTSLALMDAGVPVSAAVAGIAMGLIEQDGEFAVLSDILGDEDHFGDMDFKVVGTAEGITAVQMDIKVEGLSGEILTQALEQARQGRLHILGEMAKAIEAPRPDISKHAPRIFTILIDPDRIRDLIGPGGKHIRGIVSETGASVNVEDDGRVHVAASDNEVAQRAIEMVRAYTANAEVGKDYNGKVVRLADFGAFIQIAPGMDGLCHISELAEGRVDKVEDVCKLGDEMLVRVISVERNGKIRLSHREAMGFERRDRPAAGRSDRGSDRGGDRGGRGGERGARSAGREPRGSDRPGRRTRGDRPERSESSDSNSN